MSTVGDAAGAIAKAAKVVEATYKIDFQSHSTVGPSTALADYKNGSCVVWMGGQKPYGQQGAITDMLKALIDPKIMMDNVRVIYVAGASSFGRGESDDVSMEAAYLSALVGSTGAGAVDARRGEQLGHEGRTRPREPCRPGSTRQQGRGLQVDSRRR